MGDSLNSDRIIMSYCNFPVYGCIRMVWNLSCDAGVRPVPQDNIPWHSLIKQGKGCETQENQPELLL